MQVGVAAVYCWIAIATSQSSDAIIILVFPLYLGIPGAVVAFAIFAPIEAAGVNRGVRWISLTLIPLVGAAVPWLLFPLGGNWDNFIRGAPGLSEIGFGWGLLWVITRPVYALFRKTS